MQTDKLWKFIERFKILLELIVALLIISPIVFVLMRQGTTAVIPAWTVLPIVNLAILLGYLLGRKRRPFQKSIENQKKRTLLQTINFDYEDNPVNHGWKILDNKDKTQPELKILSDGFYGNILKIRSKTRYAMDTSVNPAANMGKAIEFVAKVRNDYGLYALVSVQSKDGSKRRDVYLSFKIGNDKPRLVEESEWAVHLSPEYLEGEWLLFRVNLESVLENSVGQSGWSYRKLRGFRLRGNIDLAYIKIYR